MAELRCWWRQRPCLRGRRLRLIDLLFRARRLCRRVFFVPAPAEQGPGIACSGAYSDSPWFGVNNG